MCFSGFNGEMKFQTIKFPVKREANNAHTLGAVFLIRANSKSRLEGRVGERRVNRLHRCIGNSKQKSKCLAIVG